MRPGGDDAPLALPPGGTLLYSGKVTLPTRSANLWGALLVRFGERASGIAELRLAPLGLAADGRPVPDLSVRSLLQRQPAQLTANHASTPLEAQRDAAAAAEAAAETEQTALQEAGLGAA